LLTDTQHKIDLNIGYGGLGPIVEWAKENCTNNWNYEIIESAGRDAGIYRFYFVEEIDYIKFTLWKT
jgi:hypothetical protein